MFGMIGWKRMAEARLSEGLYVSCARAFVCVCVCVRFFCVCVVYSFNIYIFAHSDTQSDTRQLLLFFSFFSFLSFFSFFAFLASGASSPASAAFRFFSFRFFSDGGSAAPALNSANVTYSDFVTVSPAAAACVWVLV